MSCGKSVNRKLTCPSLLLWGICFLLLHINTYGQPTDEQVLIDGHKLAQQYCTTCHDFTEPELLPKKSWEFLLTYMGMFLGVTQYGYLKDSSENAMEIIEAREEFVRAANLLPETPIISPLDWHKLRFYYFTNAPEEALPQIEKPAIVEDSDWFSVKRAQYRAENAITSLVHIDEVNSMVLIHDSGAEKLTVLDEDLYFSDAHMAPSVFLIEAESRGNELFLLNIGDLFASEIGESLGEIQQASYRAGVYYNMRIQLEELHRPADFCMVDMDGDGIDEVLVSNFGDYTGNLSMYKKDPTTGAILPDAQILSSEPGIVKSEVHDFNGDGRPDIAVLMSAARENLSIFINEGDGTFTRNIIIEAHPSYGYTGLELRDFNEDGLMDIMTLNGDNGDSDPYNSLKRDQGIRIYLNEGDLQFKEAYFYPMYGVYKVEIQDFDLDGDLDIAAIAFFPDFHPENPESFVLLQQSSDLNFVPKTHPATYNGRWLSMDSGDLDADGDKDLILGAAYSPVGMRENHEEKYQKWVKEGPPVLVLDNKTIR
jgi:hypothetical protein